MLSVSVRVRILCRCSCQATEIPSILFPYLAGPDAEKRGCPMVPWFEDEDFWTAFRPFLFSGERVEHARDDVEKLIGLLALSPGASMLDLCCGIGRHTFEFARRGFAVT